MFPTEKGAHTVPIKQQIRQSVTGLKQQKTQLLLKPKSAKTAD